MRYITLYSDLGIIKIMEVYNGKKIILYTLILFNKYCANTNTYKHFQDSNLKMDKTSNLHKSKDPTYNH